MNLKILFFTIVFFNISSLTYASPSGPRDLLSKLVAAKAVFPPGNERRSVQIVSKYLKDSGVSSEIIDFDKNRSNLVARIKGTGKKGAVLLLGHLDVVGTAGQVWTVEPFKLTEKDGYFYGRGVFDDLGMSVALIETLIRLKESKKKFDRDIILALVGGEEIGGQGMKSLIEKRPDIFKNVAVAFNEGGGIQLATNSDMHWAEMTLVEKQALMIDFRVTNRGGHSAVFESQNAVSLISQAITKMSSQPFLIKLFDINKETILNRSNHESPKLSEVIKTATKGNGNLSEKDLSILSENPEIMSLIATTCRPKNVIGGTLYGLQPSEAKAVFDCRLLPGVSPEEVISWIKSKVSDSSIQISTASYKGSSIISPADGVGPNAITSVIQKRWPQTTVAKALSVGSTDSFFLRELGVPTYGFNPIPMHSDDRVRIHGPDERIKKEYFFLGIDLMTEITEYVLNN